MSSASDEKRHLAVLLAAAPASAETFHNKDGVVFEGTIRLVVSNAAVCNVLEEKYTAQEYEQLKANQGQPLDLWQVDFAVRNESGREIEYLRASSWVHSEQPALHELERRGSGRRAGPARAQFDDLDRVGRLLPGSAEAVRDAAGAAGAQRALFGGVSRAPAAVRGVGHRLHVRERGRGREGAGCGRVPDAGERGGDVHGAGGLGIAGEPVLAVDHEQHGGGGLRGVSTPVSGTASFGSWHRIGWRPCAGRRAASSQGRRNRRGRRSKDGRLGSAPGRPAPGSRKGPRAGWSWPTSRDATSGMTTSWRTRPRHGLGSVPGGWPRGREALTWVREGSDIEESGLLRNGKKQGRGVLRFAGGTVEEGPYVDGKRHGRWVRRLAGVVLEGPYVDGKQHGQWVVRFANGTVWENTYVNGELQ